MLIYGPMILQTVDFVKQLYDSNIKPQKYYSFECLLKKVTTSICFSNSIGVNAAVLPSSYSDRSENSNSLKKTHLQHN